MKHGQIRIMEGRMVQEPGYTRPFFINNAWVYKLWFLFSWEMDRLFQMLVFTSSIGAVNVTQTSAQTWLIQTRVLMLISPLKERNGFDTSLLVLLAWVCSSTLCSCVFLSGSARYKSLHRSIHWLPTGAAALIKYTKALNHPQHLGWVVCVWD